MRSFLASRATLAFLLAAATLAAIKLLFDYYPGDFPLRDQAAAFTWPTIGGIIALSAVGLLADRSLGFPQPFENAGREWRGFWTAAALGVLYGAITIVRDLYDHDLHPFTTGEAWDHLPLPWSIPFYAFGAIFLELFLRLGALCIGVWVIHVLLLRRHFRLVVFWTVACIVALYEILPYLMDDIAERRWLDVALTPFEPLYWTNVLEAWLLLRFGWVSPIVFRLFFYVVWHLLYGGLAPQVLAG